MSGEKKIKLNRIKCLACQSIITSYHRHDFKYCPCRSVGIDGGLDYLRRLFKEVGAYEELSEFKDV